MNIGRMAAILGMVLLPGMPQDKAPGTDASKEGRKNQPGWTASGTLFEACSCNVPCPCNFGQGPSHAYCHTIYAYRLKSARYEGVALDGLIFAGGEGDKGIVGFLDQRAAPAQRTALQKLAMAVFARGGASTDPRRFLWTRLIAEQEPGKFRVDYGESGGFEADILIGADGKHPIIVENNTTWPVHRFIKGKTTKFDYRDVVGNRLNYTGVNANLGEFDLSGTTSQK